MDFTNSGRVGWDLGAGGRNIAGARPKAERRTVEFCDRSSGHAGKVWPWLNDGEKLKQWISWLVDVRAVQPEMRGAGSRQIWVMRDENNGGMLLEIQEHCVKHVEPTRKSVEIQANPGISGLQSYSVIALGNGTTRIEMESRFKFGHWLPS